MGPHHHIIGLIICLSSFQSNKKTSESGLTAAPPPQATLIFYTDSGLDKKAAAT